MYQELHAPMATFDAGSNNVKILNLNLYIVHLNKRMYQKSTQDVNEQK